MWHTNSARPVCFCTSVCVCVFVCLRKELDWVTQWPVQATFLQLHGEQVQLLHSLLQLVLGRGRHGVHVVVAAVIVLVRVSSKDLNAGEVKGQRESPPWFPPKPPLSSRLAVSASSESCDMWSYSSPSQGSTEKTIFVIAQKDNFDDVMSWLANTATSHKTNKWAEIGIRII